MRGVIIILFFFGLIGCNEQKKNQSEVTIAETGSEDSLVKFFPLTEYIQGQIALLLTTPINPLKITEQGTHIDSIWLRREQIREEMQPFLHPVIDSVNMMPYYDQSRFFDQTLNRVTLSYSIKDKEDSQFPVKRWDVYVDPKTGEVTLVFIEKKLNPQTSLQLSWQAGRYCQIVYIKHMSEDSSVVDKKTTIQWDFDEE